MNTIQFLAEWALRSSILILIGALLLRALRVKDASIRLAAWTAMLCGSLAIPALTAALPKVPLAVVRAPTRTVEAPTAASYESAPASASSAPAELLQADTVAPRGAAGAKRFDWARAAFILYVLVAGAMLLRLCAGVAMSLRLFRRSRATGRLTGGIEIRESDRVASPVTLGVVRPAIVLPEDWREWDGARLDAVLAHERSHIRRCDPAVQFLSALHRALLWYSPLSWRLHRSIVRAAEEASDDAAVAAIHDRASYAEMLLDFMQRGVRSASWQGVPMARYGRPDQRIHRILDATAPSRGVTRWSIAAILVLGAPLAYVVAAASPQSASPAQPVTATSGPAGAPAVEPAPVVSVAQVQAGPAQAAPVSAVPPLKAAVQAQTAKPSGPPPAAVDKALRARVAEFYQDFVDGKFREAEPLVAKDTKDLFFAMGKPQYFSFAIENVTYSEKFTRANVLTVCQAMMMLPGLPGGAYPAPITSTWKLEKGKWVWYVDQAALQDSPFGKMGGGAAAGHESGAVAAPPSTSFTSPDFALHKVTADKESLALKPGGSAEVTFSNSAQGVMSVSLNGKPVGFDITPAHADMALGGKATFTVKALADAPPSATLSFRVLPTSEMIEIKVAVN